MTVPEDAAVFTVTETVEQDDSAVVLAVTGEVDMLTAPRFEQALYDAVARRPLVLVIDLLGVSFFASAGLAILVKVDEKTVPPTQLRVVARGAATLRPLQLTGLVRTLAVYPTRAAAAHAG